MGCSCNSTLLQLNTFANQLFCNTKPLQLVHFVTHVFATQRFWSLFLWCPFPQLLFAQECLFTCFFFQLFVQKLVFHLTYFSEVSMGNNSFVHFCWWWLFRLLPTLPRLQVPKASRRVAGTGISHELVLCVYIFCWRFFSLAACPAGLPAWEDCPSRLPG